MEELEIRLNNLEVESATRKFSDFYRTLAEFNVTKDDTLHSFTRKILPKIYNSIVKNILRKDFILLSLLTTRNVEIYEKFIEFDKKNLKLNPYDSSSFYEFCIYKNGHWILEIVKKYENVPNFTPEIHNKIVILKCLNLTINEFSSKSIEYNSNQFRAEIETDESLIKFVKELRKCTEIIKFVRQLSPNVEEKEVFNVLCHKTTLDTLSMFIDFTEASNWSVISQKLIELKDEEDAMKFEIFTIFATILNIETNSNSMQTILENTKVKMLKVEKKILLEIVENIFGILFRTDAEPTGFKNNEVVVQCILRLIKSVIDEVKLRKFYEKGDENYEKFTRICKTLHDVLWRFELVRNVKKSTSTKLLYYMMAPPASLLSMCLRHSNFNQAYHVIEMFNLQNTQLAAELQFTENLRDLRNSIRKFCRFQQMNKMAPPDVTLEKLLEKITTSVPFSKREHDEIIENSPEHSYLCHFKQENETFMNIFDILCTNSSENIELNKLILKSVKENYKLSSNIVSVYSKFTQNLVKITERLSLNVTEILTDSNVSLDVIEYERRLQFDDELMMLYEQFKNETSEINGGLNVGHVSHKIYAKIEKLCNGHSNVNVNYLGKLYNYLRAFSKVLNIGGDSSNYISNGKNTSFFQLLNFNRSELMGYLLFELNKDPSEFETFFENLKLDFLYHLVGNCFPTINLHTDEFVTEDELFPENNLYVPSGNIINYIMKRNWLLALILIEMYELPDLKFNVNASRINVFQNYRNLCSTKRLVCLFDNNEMITALQHEIPLRKLKKIIEQFCESPTTQSTCSNLSDIETGEEIIEDFKPPIGLKQVCEILQAITELQVKKSYEIRELNDKICTIIIRKKQEPNYFLYLNSIHDPVKKHEIFMENSNKFPAKFVLEFIETQLSTFEECAEVEKLETLKETVEICDKVGKLLEVFNWHECLEIIEHAPETAFEKLLETCDLEHVSKFLHKFRVNIADLMKLDEDCCIKMLKNNEECEKLREILEMLPVERSLELCSNMLKLTSNLRQLEFFLGFLKEKDSETSWKKHEITLEILRKLHETERGNFLKLFANPLCIFEIYVMNAKLDKLNLISELFAEFQSETDEILRRYAEKTLEFRVVTKTQQQQVRPLEKLIESMDSTDSDNSFFLMPSTVPSKEEWVENSEVLQCQCCKNVVFSMFNRRHHCRRCGRVICYVCSRKMNVETYGELLVRVCIDCYTQTEGNCKSFSTTSSEKSEFWLLCDDDKTNRITRDEFSYEHAPSVSLCLNLLKHHSVSIEHAVFLLTQCENLLKLLQPEVEEIDHSLVVKMSKTLAVSAKIKSQECGYVHGIATSERYLNQLELYALFVERSCLNLLQTQRIEVATLRKLRDKLLEAEQWNLALEVSMKSGLDGVDGVFAAWGKSCLKSGCLTKAREKFQRCLDKKKGDTEKPLKNPPLLNEIIQILEAKTTVIDRELVEEINAAYTVPFTSSTSTINASNASTLLVQKDSAVSILNKLRNLDNIARGRYYFQPDKRQPESYATNRPIIDTVFYNECIFYLGRYGSHQSLMEFYLKHGELDQALQYILDNNINIELFIEIYMRCLKDGIVNILQENILKIDSTLDLWKNHLRQLCRHLEKQKLFNSLYQLQLFMGDYLRAAMTCIRFYEENAKNFSDLARKNHFLHKAEEHIKQIYEQEQWVEVAPVRSGNTSVSYSTTSIESFEEKSITNPSLVMKLGEKNLKNYLNIIWRQNEVASYLADCEAAKMEPMEILKSILPDSDVDSSSGHHAVPTLFGDAMEKSRIAILVLLTSLELDRGFKITSRLISDFKLRQGTVYCQAGKHLAKCQKFDAIIELVHLIKNNGNDVDNLTEICDEMLTLAVATLAKEKAPITKVEDLIKLISDKAIKISAYIEAKQLKTAYFFAVRFKRMSDIRRILREAELNNQPNIKALCLKVLQAHSQNTKE